MGLFFRPVLGGYMRATRYKTPYRWLHGGYMSGEKKNPATNLIAGFPLYWRRGWDSPNSPNLQRRNPELKVQSYTVKIHGVGMAGW